MNAAQARKRIRALDAEDAPILYRSHADAELRADGIDRHDVHRILRTGAVTAPPESDLKFGNWVCRVEGADQDGRRICIVVGVWDKRDLLVVITGFTIS